MPRIVPVLVAALMLFSSAVARAQTAAEAATQQVAGLAPQLALFAGSPANLQALAAGLVLGQPIVMTAITADGIAQTVTVTPTAAMSAVDAASVLERARQALITRGIASPTPEQIGVTLTGGTLPTPVGNALVTGILTGTIDPAATQVQRQVAGSAPLGGTPANLQNLTNGLTTGTPITLTGATAGGTPTSLTFTVPGGGMSAFEASQALQLASQLLASQGIANPTPEQLRAALLGGTVTGPAGAANVRGVLEGRGTVQTAISRPGTSSSVVVNTSASPVVGTSTSPTTSTNLGANTGALPPAAAVPPDSASRGNGAPSPAAQMQGRR